MVAVEAVKVASVVELLAADPGVEMGAAVARVAGLVVVRSALAACGWYVLDVVVLTQLVRVVTVPAVPVKALALEADEEAVY